MHFVLWKCHITWSRHVSWKCRVSRLVEMARMENIISTSQQVTCEILREHSCKDEVAIE